VGYGYPVRTDVDAVEKDREAERGDSANSVSAVHVGTGDEQYSNVQVLLVLEEVQTKRVATFKK